MSRRVDRIISGLGHYFGVIAKDIIKKEKYNKEDISIFVEKWKASGMYLSDLSCCDEECGC